MINFILAVFFLFVARSPWPYHVWWHDVNDNIGYALAMFYACRSAIEVDRTKLREKEKEKETND